MFEGDLSEGELEIGQVCAQVKKIEQSKYIINNIWNDYLNESNKIYDFTWNLNKYYPSPCYI